MIALLSNTNRAVHGTSAIVSVKFTDTNRPASFRGSRKELIRGLVLVTLRGVGISCKKGGRPFSPPAAPRCPRRPRRARLTRQAWRVPLDGWERDSARTHAVCQSTNRPATGGIGHAMTEDGLRARVSAFVYPLHLVNPWESSQTPSGAISTR